MISPIAVELIAGVPVKRGEKTDKTKKWLHDYLDENGGAVKSTEAVWDASKFGHAERMLNIAKKELNIKSKKYGSDWYWLTPHFDDSQLTLEGKPTVKKKHGGPRSGSGRKNEKKEPKVVFVRDLDKPEPEPTPVRPEVGGACIKCQKHFPTTAEFLEHSC